MYLRLTETFLECNLSAGKNHSSQTLQAQNYWNDLQRAFCDQIGSNRFCPLTHWVLFERGQQIYRRLQGQYQFRMK